MRINTKLLDELNISYKKVCYANIVYPENKLYFLICNNKVLIEYYQRFMFNPMEDFEEQINYVCYDIYNLPDKFEYDVFYRPEIVSSDNEEGFDCNLKEEVSETINIKEFVVFRSNSL